MDAKKRLYTWMNENEEIYQLVCWMSMAQDAMVYKVSSCFFFMVSFFVFDVAQLELGPNPSITLCKLPFH